MADSPKRYPHFGMPQDRGVATASKPPALFNWGRFSLHSGVVANWKIDCDALSDRSIEALARLIAEHVEFDFVEGVPTGGMRLANALRKFSSLETGVNGAEPEHNEGRLLIVDDVMTSGGSMEEHRAGRAAKGVVIFAREKCPDWVTPIFTYTLERKLPSVVATEVDEDGGSLAHVRSVRDELRAQLGYMKRDRDELTLQVDTLEADNLKLKIEMDELEEIVKAYSGDIAELHQQLAEFDDSARRITALEEYIGRLEERQRTMASLLSDLAWEEKEG